ncbi:hypothetical protein PQR12_11600 [Paraburkholderia nemoris]|uniref:hypothetical protein n=1 Tax=Paraburkholderia nemoris TaxID=2793076 RepID=UPI0038B95BEA
MRDPISITIGWSIQRLFYFVCAVLASTFAGWQWLMVRIFGLSFVDAFGLGARVLSRNADITSTVMACCCALIALLTTSVVYLGIAVWWSGRGQVELHSRGARLRG